MKKLGLSTVLCIVCLLTPPAWLQAEGLEPHFSSAPKVFLSANEAVDFANSLAPKERLSVQFLSEYSEGAGAGYKVIYKSGEDSSSAVQEINWRVNGGFADLDAAKEFANVKRVKAQFVSLWNPTSAQVRTTLTIFYWTPLTPLPPNFQYRIADESFFPASKAVEYVNSELKRGQAGSAQFVSEFYIATQLESSWRVIFLENQQGETAIDAKWQLQETDAHGFPLYAKTAVDFANQEKIGEGRFVASVNTWSLNSRVTMFYCARSRTRQTVR